MISHTAFFYKNTEDLNLKKKPLPRFRVPSALSLINFYCVFKTCKMDAKVLIQFTSTKKPIL